MLAHGVALAAAGPGSAPRRRSRQIQIRARSSATHSWYQDIRLVSRTHPSDRQGSTHKMDALDGMIEGSSAATRLQGPTEATRAAVGITMRLQPPHGCRQPIVERQAASGDTVKPSQRRACRQPTVARDPASSALTAWRSILLMGPYTTTKPPQPAAYRQPIADIRLVAVGTSIHCSHSSPSSTARSAEQACCANARGSTP